jgi:F0F1-type ATP synthase assembly protein I
MTMATKRDINWKQGLVFLGVGIELVALTVGMGYLGMFLDETWETQPTFMVAGLILGAALGLYHFIRLASRFF